MDRVVTIDGTPDAAQALASWTALFPEAGEYVIAKAEPVSAPPEGDFETWFLRALYERTRDHFVTAQYAMWEVLDELLRRRRVRVPSELDLWELNRTLFDLSTASTARMVGLRVPNELIEQLTGMGWSVPEALDFPALGYRMGLIYDRLQSAKPVAWSELREMAEARPLSSAEREAIDYMRRRGGVWMRPILDGAGNVWTAEREIAPMRRIGSAALADRASTQAAARELANSQRARGIVRDAERVMRTELAEARGRGVWVVVAKGAPPDALFFRQVASSPCRVCLRLFLKPDGTPQLYRRDDIERWSETVNTGPRETWTPKIGPVHPSCFPSDVMVSTSSAPRLGYERFWRGELIVLDLGGGDRLPCTPNHPVLTRRGWVPAGLLDVRDDVVGGSFAQGVFPGDVQYQQVPARIQDVVRAFGRADGVAPTPVPVAAEDFHGDGGDSQIAVVRTNGLLGDDIKAALAEHLGQLDFEQAAAGALRGACLCSLVQLFRRACGAAYRSVRGKRVLAPPYRGEAGVPEVLRSRAGAQRHAEFGQAEGDTAAADAKAYRQRQYRFSGLVASEQRFQVDGPAVCFAARAPRNFSAGEAIPNHLLRNAEPFRDHAQRVALAIECGEFCDVHFTRLRGVRRVGFEGYVFNLSTRHRFYLANGVVVHNCLCSPWSRYYAELAPLFEQFAPANREQLARFGVHQGE